MCRERGPEFDLETASDKLHGGTNKYGDVGSVNDSHRPTTRCEDRDDNVLTCRAGA